MSSSNSSSNNSDNNSNELNDMDDNDFKYKLYYEIKDYFNNKKNLYINHSSLMNRIESIITNVGTTQVNRCIECNCDIGECNPRQLCGKWVCSNKE
jgi:hypothetical protein